MARHPSWSTTGRAARPEKKKKNHVRRLSRQRNHTLTVVGGKPYTADWGSWGWSGGGNVRAPATSPAPGTQSHLGLSEPDRARKCRVSKKRWTNMCVIWSGQPVLPDRQCRPTRGAAAKKKSWGKSLEVGTIRKAKGRKRQTLTRAITLGQKTLAGGRQADGPTTAKRKSARR